MTITGYIRIPFEYDGIFEPDSEEFYQYLDEVLNDCAGSEVLPDEVVITEVSE